MLDLLCLTDAVKYGTWIADRHNEACFLYRNPENGNQYKGSLKVTGGGYETYIQTFHRCHGRQWKSVMKRGLLIE